jgi:hypothetical protein
VTSGKRRKALIDRWEAELSCWALQGADPRHLVVSWADGSGSNCTTCGESDGEQGICEACAETLDELIADGTLPLPPMVR